ncbi:MAG TPA: polyprenol monophosphomannose synthase, partial [Anaerolineae bacterium]
PDLPWRASRQVEAPAVYVVIPTYNEGGNLPPLAAALFDLPVPNLTLVVVDDNSPDGTGEIAEVLGQRYAGRVHTIHRPGKQGLGAAYRHGFRHALQEGADFVVQMDADFSHSPDYIPQFLQYTNAYDIIVGSRFVDGSGLDPSWSWSRKLLTRWANSVYVRMILNLQQHDATAGFKLWSRRALSAVLAYPVHSGGFVFQVEMAYLAEILGFRTLEVPIYFEDRHEGASKMSGAIQLEAAWRTLYLRWQYRRLRGGAQPTQYKTAPDSPKE